MRTDPKVFRDQFQSFQDEVEGWKCDHDQAMAVRDLEDAIAKCRIVNRQVKRQITACLEHSMADSRESRVLRSSILKALDAGASTWASLDEVAQHFVTKERYDVDGSDYAAKCVEEFATLKRDVISRWRGHSPEDLQAGLTEIRAGKGITTRKDFDAAIC